MTYQQFLWNLDASGAGRQLEGVEGRLHFVQPLVHCLEAVVDNPGQFFAAVIKGVNPLGHVYYSSKNVSKNRTKQKNN